jgi:hypothetical protein
VIKKSYPIVKNGGSLEVEIRLFLGFFAARTAIVLAEQFVDIFNKYFQVKNHNQIDHSSVSKQSQQFLSSLNAFVVRSFVCSFVRSFVRLFFVYFTRPRSTHAARCTSRLFARLFVRLFVCSSVRPFVRSSVCPL